MGTSEQGSAIRVKASPLARRIASEQGVDLSQVKGSGPEGRVLLRDVETGTGFYARNKSVAPSAKHSLAQNKEEKKEHSPSPQIIQPSANLKSLSHSSPSQLSLVSEVDASEAERLVERLQEREEFHGISLNHLALKACAYALSEAKELTAVWQNGKLSESSEVNISLISLSKRGLLSAVITDAAELPLQDLVFETRTALDRAKQSRQGVADSQSKNFSLILLEGDGVHSASMTPEQGGVLSISKRIDSCRLNERGGVPGSLITAALTADSQIVDLATARTFLTRFKEAVELPAIMFI